MIGPLPPSFTICVTISRFALCPAAAAMRAAKSFIAVMRAYFVADSRVFTTCRIVSTNPSKPTSTLARRSLASAVESWAATDFGRLRGFGMGSAFIEPACGVSSGKVDAEPCFTLRKRHPSLTRQISVGFRKGCRACIPSFPLSFHEQFYFSSTLDWQLYPSAAPAPCPRPRRVWRIAPSYDGPDPFPAKFFDVVHPPLACFSASRAAIFEPCTFPQRFLAKRRLRALRQHIHDTSSAIVS